MDPIDGYHIGKTIGSEDKLEAGERFRDGGAADVDDFFRHGDKSSKINDTIDFLKAETGGFDFGNTQLESKTSSGVESLNDTTTVVHDAEVVNKVDGVSNVVQDKFEEDLLGGLSESHKESVEMMKPVHSPPPPVAAHLSDNVKDLLFDEKEQDELKGFDQYTSDSNASLKVNLSCENDDTASTKSVDSAQSIPLDDRKNLAKESFTEEPLSTRSEESDVLASSKSSNPSLPSTDAAQFGADFEMDEAPPVDTIIKQEAKPFVDELLSDAKSRIEAEVLPKVETKRDVTLEQEIVKQEEEVVVSKPIVPEPETPKVKTPPVQKIASTEMFIGPHEVFSRIGLDTWFNPEKLNPKVESLVYWRDPKISGAVFGASLAVLISLAYFSLISVVANLALLVLVAAIGFRIYKCILQAVQKTNEGHPFKAYLEQDLSLPSEKVQAFSESAVTHLNVTLVELRRIFLVEDFVDSIKFVIILWTFTYVGSWFNGLTLVIIGFVALFTLPKVYENNQAQIDANLELVKGKIAEITSKVKAAIPIGKKEEKKDQ